MLIPCLPSLLDLCCIRLAYLVCIRRLSADYYRTVDEFFNENEIAALAAAQGLPIPVELKPRLVKYVKPAGGRLFSLLSLWLRKLPPDTPQRWRIGSMLFDCLVLNAHGLIKERRTAQTLLSNTILHNVLAFRLACINFLETEVLKLWMLVREYFLNKRVREGNRPDSFMMIFHGSGPVPEDVIEGYHSDTTEDEDVLFWIAYCLSREKAVDISEVPHFEGKRDDCDLKTMVSPSVASLLDLCGIRLAYLLWTRRDVADDNRFVNYLVHELEIEILADARKIPLPIKLQSLVVNHVKPTGGHLLYLLSLWLSKLPSDTPQKFLTGGILFDCLVLNADGLINQRRTAQTLLSNKILHNVLAFRLACINFLETEVLKLWILVKVHFMNKIVREADTSRLYINRTGPMEDYDIEDYYNKSTEPEEVLFWIGYCLSRENAVDLREVPHFMGMEVDWYECALQSAVSSGNVACFEYFKSFRDGPFEYDYVDTIKRILTGEGGNCQHSSFIFHFMLLNFQEKSELFRQLPKEMVNQFLQWPLSQTFLQKAEEVWNLLPYAYKHLVFSEVRKILIFENVLLHKGYISHTFQSFLTYCAEHLLGIWHALWNVSPDNYKSAFLDLYIFPDFQGFNGDEFPSRFVTSGLKQKLRSLFLSNGGAVLELYQKETLQESLRSVVAEYMSADFQDLEGRYLSFFEGIRMPLRRFKKNRRERLDSEIMSYRGSPVNGSYLDYINNVVFSSDRIQHSFPHYLKINNTA